MDSYSFAFIFVGAIAGTWYFSAPVKHIQMAAPATAVAQTSSPAAEGYKISVSAKRIPAECKSLTDASDAALVLRCSEARKGETQMTIVPVDERVKVATTP